MGKAIILTLMWVGLTGLVVFIGWTAKPSGNWKLNKK